MPDMSVELVEGALGESADFLIATYGMSAVHMDGLKPAAFKPIVSAGPDKPVSTAGLEEKWLVGLLQRVSCRK